MCCTEEHTLPHAAGGTLVYLFLPDLSVLIGLCSHRNSLWSWLPRCRPRVHAPSNTSTQHTLQLCEIYCTDSSVSTCRLLICVFVWLQIGFVQKRKIFTSTRTFLATIKSLGSVPLPTSPLPTAAERSASPRGCSHKESA